MKAPYVTPLLLCLAALVSAGAWADGIKVYKWTDAQGLLHYSDKPPLDAAADLQTLQFDLPPVDTAALAASEAQMAQLSAALRQQQAEDDLARQRQELAAQQAELEATLATLQQATVEAAPPQEVFYAAAASPFIRQHHEPDRDDFMRMPHPRPKATLPTPPLAVTSLPGKYRRP